MRFESYPLDSHVCDFLISSWIYSEDVLNLTMNSLTFDAENQVSLLDYKPEVRDLAKSKQRKYYVDTYWRIAGFEIVLHRNVHKYIANYYIPTGFLVLVSWVEGFGSTCTGGSTCKFFNILEFSIQTIQHTTIQHTSN